MCQPHYHFIHKQMYENYLINGSTVEDDTVSFMKNLWTIMV